MEIISNQTIIPFDEAFKAQCPKCGEILDWEPSSDITPLDFMEENEQRIYINNEWYGCDYFASCCSEEYVMCPHTMKITIQ